MPRPEIPCLSIAIARLKSPAENHFAAWVLQAPYPSGYVHHDCIWPETLSQVWQAWQEMFCPQTLPRVVAVATPQVALTLSPSLDAANGGKTLSYSSRLMQHLGISLWQWLIAGPIQGSLHESKGIAIGQNQPLRVRLDLREPDLIALPWEIMQPQAGQPAISLGQQLLFSRTTSDVEPLPTLHPGQSLNILLVLGQGGGDLPLTALQLEQEAAALAKVLNISSKAEINGDRADAIAPTLVETLIQPTPAELISRLEAGTIQGQQPYNILFYAGHGMPGPDGGLLFLQPDTTLNGTELAQVLVRCRVTLAVFNACWGAQPAVEVLTNSSQQQALSRSSLAEVLIHHGVPAVLGMRDAIADREALSFIQAFAQAMAARMPVDQAVTVARQQLLTLYKFNQPAWTLPVLYMHPEFDGQLLTSVVEIRTELPANSPTWMGRSLPIAYLRSVTDNARIWPIAGAIVQIGRTEENNIAISESWVSQKHAEIFCRNSDTTGKTEPTYFLRDFSRYGTLILGPEGWQRIHHQEVALKSGTQLKFGSSQGQSLEFILEVAKTSPHTGADCGTN
ncbi:MAG TPA: CHAT domain-containing protein [Kamptonema sp.]|nr:CHAT domain-containing protein [Kamptonema sp.]